MKKLKFKLEGKEMLSKEQMKKISGGSGYTTCGCGLYVGCSFDQSYVLPLFLAYNASCDDDETLDELCDIHYPTSKWLLCDCPC